MPTPKRILKLTDLELVTLCSVLDTYSALVEGIEDDGTALKELRRVDRMLKKNGYKRQHN